VTMNETSLLHSFKGIIDSTLREGLQFSRADFTLGEMKAIYASLARIGVDFVEVGNPAQPKIREMIAALVRARRGRGPRLLSHIRNHPDDIVRAIEAGVQGVNILCTVDPERLEAMRLTPEAYAERLRNNIRTAKDRGLLVRVGVEDFFGQTPPDRLDIHALAVECGADRIAVADTLGRTMEWEVFRRIRTLRRRFGTDIEAHFHNDLGHAVSNAIVALQAGANWISTSLLGIGERTGITPLSSLLANIHILDETAAGRYDLRSLTPAESAVARLCGMDMPPHLVTNPANGFAHKAGIHLDALMKFGPRKYECLVPEVFGNKRTLVIDSNISGKTTAEDVRAFEKRYGSGPA
jgi:homocitrate synthase